MELESEKLQKNHSDLINHVCLVQHVRIEEPVPQSDVFVHFSIVRSHPSQHRPDQRMSEAESRRGELVEDAGVACRVVVG